jgi:imidazolonepropionase-like amidohydrolase/Tol biopolymer transport system component
MKAYLVRIFLCLLTCALVGGLAAARTIEFETTEVTAAGVTLSPDGQWLIFTILGHLFRLPVTGGTAEQLTFGPYYDFDPVFSPDGARAAFTSNRDGSEGNVFVLELPTGQITQVTHEAWAGRPTWAPDGQAIVYLRFVGGLTFSPPGQALVRRVTLSGGEPETLSGPRRGVRSVFYLPDGRLAWTVLEWQPESPRRTTRIEVMSPRGTVSTLRTLEGSTLRVVPNPTGDGLYCRRRKSGPFREDLLFLPLPDGAERLIVPLERLRWWHPRFAVAADNKSLYLGEAGRLWEIALPSGARKPIAFRARVRLEIQDPVPPPKWAPAAPGSSVPPRSVLWPRLSPDGRSLVFGAAGYLWHQRLDGGQAQRLFEGSAVEGGPAFSPDGRRLAFVRSEHGQDDQIMVFNFENRQMRTLASAWLYRHLSWNPDGQRLVFVEAEVDEVEGEGIAIADRLGAVNVSDGKKETFAEVHPSARRPHFSADGQSLYFTANGTVYRLPLKEGAKPEAITQLERQLSHALVSPDGKWLAFRRNSEIWVAPLGKEPVKEEEIRQLSPEGWFSFAFMPDGPAVIYAAGNRVWRHPLAGGEREEIPIRLELPRPTPPPVLLRRVRVLDFPSGGFGPETSLYIEQGRIRWIGSERARQLPPETLIVDAGGRFAIPGLFDMHVHASEGWTHRDLTLRAFLAYGVTSARDVGSGLRWLNALADRSEATSEPVPRYFYAGDIFHAEWGSLRIHSEDEARSYVRRWKERGAHFIKAYVDLPWSLHRAVAEEARRQGLPVIAHGRHLKEITKAVTLGYAGLEHTTRPSRVYDDIFQMLAAAGTRWDPVAGHDLDNMLLVRHEPERLEDAKLRAFASEWYIRWLQAGGRWRAIRDKVLRGTWVDLLADIRAAHRRGVKLLAGSHALANEFVVSLHWELEHFVEAGIPPLEVLRIATQEGAAAVGAEDDLGTIEPGKLADLVLLDANPLEDIKNTQTIWRVIKGGWLFDPEKLRPPKSGSDDE